MDRYKILQYKSTKSFRRMDKTPHFDKEPIANYFSSTADFGFVVTNEEGQFYVEWAKGYEDLDKLCKGSGLYDILGTVDANSEEYVKYLEFREKYIAERAQAKNLEGEDGKHTLSLWRASAPAPASKPIQTPKPAQTKGSSKS